MNRLINFTVLIMGTSKFLFTCTVNSLSVEEYYNSYQDFITEISKEVRIQICKSRIGKIMSSQKADQESHFPYLCFYLLGYNVRYALN